MMKRAIFLILMITCTVCLACSLLVPDTYEPPVFSLRFHQESVLAKAAAIDQVWVLVGDYNPWVIDYDNEQYQDYEAHHVITPDNALWNIFNYWDPDSLQYGADSTAVFNFRLDTREGWNNYLSQFSLPIVSEQRLTIVADTARGAVIGVPGSSWIIVGFEQAGKVTHFYNQVVQAQSGDTTAINIYGYGITAIPQRRTFNIL